MRIMSIRTRTYVLAVLGAWALATGCTSRPESAPPPERESTGDIHLGLELAPGSSLSEATYTIAGPGGYQRSVKVALGSSRKLSTFIGGTPPGRGYVLTITGLANDGVSVCSGVSAPFDVIGGKTTVVSLVLRCQEPEATGGIQTNGSLNYCAAVDAVMAAPVAAPVGATIALTSSARDRDSGPSPISFAWRATGGALSGATAPSATFTCTAPGSVAVTLTVSDGDCGDSRQVNVTCTTSPLDAAPAPSPPDAGMPDTAPDAVPDARPGREVNPADPCLRCESSSPEPACASRYNRCVTIPGLAAAGPAAGLPRNELCLDLLDCVHATRCDAGGILRDCFCGRLVDEYTCKMNPVGVCRDAFLAAGETTSNAAVLARWQDPAFALAAGASLIEECEQKPEPLCGAWCGH